LYLALPPNKRLIIGISGVPGSGKTTLAKLLVHNLNTLASSEIAILVPLDGFHLTRKQLDELPNPEEAHLRRGAPWTFDAQGYVDAVHQVRNQSLENGVDVLLPSFSHTLKDPVYEDVRVRSQHTVVVFEGLYVALNHDPWNQPVKDGCFDEIWFTKVDKDVASERLAKRHVAAGISPTIEAGRKRAVENDQVNGDEIIRVLDQEKVNEMIESKEDSKWVSNDGG
jgi:pantothenate kinase